MSDSASGVVFPAWGFVFVQVEPREGKVGSLYLVTNDSTPRNSLALPRMGRVTKVSTEVSEVTAVAPGDRVLFNPFHGYEFEKGMWAVRGEGLYCVVDPGVVVEPLSIQEQG